MGTSDERVISEVVELAEAVFSDGDEYFENGYDGSVEDYIIINDLKNRIEEATMDAGEMAYPEELEPFDEFFGAAETSAAVFYHVSPDMQLSDFSETLDISESHVSSILGELEEYGLVESEGNTRGKEYFYGENALPYLMLFSEVDYLTADTDTEVVDDQLPEPEETGNQVEDVEEEVKDEQESSGNSLHDIMKDVADSRDDLITTDEQRQDGGIETRDRIDAEEDENASNPSEDEYYEGW